MFRRGHIYHGLLSCLGHECPSDGGECLAHPSHRMTEYTGGNMDCAIYGCLCALLFYGLVLDAMSGLTKLIYCLFSPAIIVNTLDIRRYNTCGCACAAAVLYIQCRFSHIMIFLVYFHNYKEHDQIVIARSQSIHSGLKYIKQKFHFLYRGTFCVFDLPLKHFSTRPCYCQLQHHVFS